MLNFSIGPVMCSEEILAIGAQQLPYFRTAEFSAMMLENEALMKELAKAPDGARAVFLTGSGTAGMEAAVMNFLSERDNAIVIDGGSFGHRFAEMLELHGIRHSVLRPEPGCGITAEQLRQFENRDYTAFLVNLDETSVGVLYDIRLISDFCRRNRLFLIVDSISSFLCDPFDMAALDVQVMITGSQKALACPPGIAALVMSGAAVERACNARPKTMYLNLQAALKDGERGQTPFTPAVGILRQLNRRLRQLAENGGADAEVRRMGELASYFRARLESLPLSIYSRSLSNAVTPLAVREGISAYDVFLTLKDEYGIWVCPNGGALRDKIFRVGHLGALQKADYDVLIDALTDMQRKKLL